MNGKMFDLVDIKANINISSNGIWKRSVIKRCVYSVDGIYVPCN